MLCISIDNFLLCQSTKIVRSGRFDSPVGVRACLRVFEHEIQKAVDAFRNLFE